MIGLSLLTGGAKLSDASSLKEIRGILFVSSWAGVLLIPAIMKLEKLRARRN